MKTNWQWKTKRIQELVDAIQDAWSTIPAPPVEDMAYMTWAQGEEFVRDFAGVAPRDIDLQSDGFIVAKPLFDLPSRAAAAYLGPFLLALLRSLDFQKTVGIFSDVRQRAHILTCLQSPDFWEEIRPFLPPKCREVLAQVTLYVASEQEAYGLRPEKVETMKALAADYLKPD